MVMSEPKFGPDASTARAKVHQSTTLSSTLYTMAQSAEYTPSHPSLVWPRSDGTSSSWPGRNTPDQAAQNGKYYEPVPDRDSRYLAFEERAGEHLAAVLGLPKRPSESTRCAG